MKNLFFIGLKTLIFCAFVRAQQPVLVKSIGEGTSNSYPTGAVSLSGKLVFFTSGGTICKLWTSDGTESGTIVIAQWPSTRLATSSSDANFNFVNGSIYYFVLLNENGKELWRTDGTSAGTFMIQDIEPGSSGSNPRNFCAYGDNLIFDATTSGHTSTAQCQSQYRHNIYQSDGSNSGVSVLFDNCNIPSYIHNINNTIIIYEPYPSWTPGLFRLNGNSLVNLSNEFRIYDYFIPHFSNISTSLSLFASNANGSGQAYYALWKTDGTPEGTSLVSTINGQTDKYQLGTSTSTAIVGNKLFFPVNHFPAGSNSVDYNELWMSDGTTLGTKKIKEFIPSGTATFGLKNFVSFNGILLFIWNSQNQSEWWRSDGTAAGTYKIMNSSYTWERYLVHDTLLYFTYDGLEALWKTDGTVGGTQKVAEFFPNYTEDIRNLTLVNDTLFFTVTEQTSAQKQQLLYKMGSTSGIDSYSSSSKINVSPNPSFGKFTITNNRGITAIEIFDLQGVKIYSNYKTNLQTLIEIDLLNYQEGIYFLKVFNNEECHTEKIMIR